MADFKDISNESELNKLKKSDLINIILDLSTKINSRLSASHDYETSSDVHNSESNNLSSCATQLDSNSTPINKPEIDNMVLKVENTYLKNLISRLESENSLQKSFIDVLLASKPHTTNGISMPVTETNKVINNKTYSSVIRNSSQDCSTPSNPLASKQAIRNMQTSTSTATKSKQRHAKTPVVLSQNNLVTLPFNTRGQHKFVTGTADNVNKTLQAAKKKAWIFVGRVDKGTSNEDLLQYLHKKCPNTNFDCEKLSTKGPSGSFKIGFELDLLPQVMEPKFWPTGIIVSRFQFFRQRRNLQQKT